METGPLPNFYRMLLPRAYHIVFADLSASPRIVSTSIWPSSIEIRKSCCRSIAFSGDMRSTKHVLAMEVQVPPLTL